MSSTSRGSHPVSLFDKSAYLRSLWQEAVVDAAMSDCSQSDLTHRFAVVCYFIALHLRAMRLQSATSSCIAARTSREELGDEMKIIQLLGFTQGRFDQEVYDRVIECC